MSREFGQVGRIARAESLISRGSSPKSVRFLEDMDANGEELSTVGYDVLESALYAESKLAQDLQDSIEKRTTIGY